MPEGPLEFGGKGLALPGWQHVCLSVYPLILPFLEQSVKLRPPTRLKHTHAPCGTPWQHSENRCLQGKSAPEVPTAPKDRPLNSSPSHGQGSSLDESQPEADFWYLANAAEATAPGNTERFSQYIWSMRGCPPSCQKQAPTLLILQKQKWRCEILYIGTYLFIICTHSFVV